ncbi:Kynurenine--oxoglutarate transaminase 3, partial [Lamellibrachia satsuma]
RTMSSSKFQLSDRLKGTNKGFWVELTSLAVEHKALNLGMGFPDFLPSNGVMDALAQVVHGNNPALHQYTRSYGHPRLVRALADTYGKVMDRSIDANQEVLVTGGAFGSLFCAVLGLINPGDEVIIIEPYFDCFEPMVQVAGGIPVFVALKPVSKQVTGDSLSSADWKLDPEELASKFTEKTKAIFLNNPNNPVGKVYTLSELQMVAELCKKHDVVVFADDVYEWLVYGSNKHIKIATLPGMWERTITIGSAGKVFGTTGWKLGWSIGPAHLIHHLQAMHQNSDYTSSTPLQEAVAVGLELELSRLGEKDCYYKTLPAELLPKRNRMIKLLSEVGMIPTIPDGSYFIIADFSNLDVKLDDSNPESKDYQFVKWLTINKKLAAVPASAFYSQPHKHLAHNLVRFAFVKEDSTLDKLEVIMKNWSL